MAVAAGRLRVWRRLRGMPLMPTIILAVATASAIFPSLIAPHDPIRGALGNMLRPPFWMEGGSTDFLLGTDRLGRDILSRMVFGARVSLTLAALSILFGGFVGSFLGLLAGYFGGWVDSLIMRFVDITLSLPIILVAFLLVILLGPSYANVIAIIAAIIWARYSRQIRGEVLSVKERDFVALARIAGASHVRIMVRHIFPNVLNTLIVLATLQVGWVIVVASSLSFLGAGIPPPTPEWGLMVAEGRDLLSTGWWVSIFPGAAILLAVLSFNLLGDWLRDTLDPKLRQV